MSTATPTRKTKPLSPVVAEIQRARREKYEQDARDALGRMQQRLEDEGFYFSYDPHTSTLRYRVRIAEQRGAQVQNVRWRKDFWMVELTEVVSHPQIS